MGRRWFERRIRFDRPRQPAPASQKKATPAPVSQNQVRPTSPGELRYPPRIFVALHMKTIRQRSARFLSALPIGESWGASTIVSGIVLTLMLVGTRTTVANESSDSRLPEIADWLGDHCVDCHSGGDSEAGLDLANLDFSPDAFSQLDFESSDWEKILRRLETRQMPPPGADRPDENAYAAITESLRMVLEHRAQEFPRPGRVAAIRRLTRLEYQYSIRDLLGIEIDAADYLPKDESSHGFDNITVEELSPTHLNRYLTAGQSISRAAVGGRGNGPVGVTIRQPADRSQESHVAGLPFGTRGGVIFDHHFHRSGMYEIEVKLTRDRDEKVEGLNRPHDMDVLIDRKRVHRFRVQPIKSKGDWKGNDFTHADSHLHARIAIQAGSRSVGVTFPKTSSSLNEIKRQPFDANFNRHRHPRLTPAIFQVSLVGPFERDGTIETEVARTTEEASKTEGDFGLNESVSFDELVSTASRDLIFGADFDFDTATREDATRILAGLARRAYRRPVENEDIEPLLSFFDEGLVEGGFERGIESALTAILVNPNFLFRIEAAGKELDQSIARSVAGNTTGHVGNIGDYELASRLSYFLWSSLPDDRLLDLAAEGELQQDVVLQAEVKRMLADEKSIALVDNFASQWLYLRNLGSITPDLRLFPDFDDNLRQAFAQETKLLFQDVLQNDGSVLDLISTQTTFLNERLAKHYGIRGVHGSAFRPVALSPSSRRGGILRHGSILMATSYATRTSPTIRGNWILENIFGTPAPPPPANVPNLKENTAIEVTTLRERLAAHRANPACASCHDRMDPLGFALQNYDAVGRWREFETDLAIDSSGQLPDGSDLSSVDELEAGIVARPEVFVRTLTEKLMTYALGRAVGPDDGPAVRRIVQFAADHDNTMSSIITGIALSDPFRKRTGHL
ncbi:Planctomycete cytochrome C [Neorhodopirellula lusitana]|uniref:Planctomycete cytochrome C n=2 Tax=Neorhodopirellula lusitana TaxID=445327 RepID=A0ABY1QJZ6_9BACT|nr:Planctomycete cytochrome C [Neorhodopirellula lusitana]